MTSTTQVLSRAAQVAEILRDEIRRGTHGEFLPGEVALASRLQVSRPTLRGALEVLRREGFLRTIKGQRTRIEHTSLSVTASKEKTIGVISASPHDSLTTFSLYLIGRLQSAAQTAGHRFELIIDPRLDSRRLSRHLLHRVERTRAACWVHLSPVTTRERWFQSMPTPSIVIGCANHSRRLHVLDIDRQAVSRHAVGLLQQRGLSQIALITPREGSASEGHPTEGFCEAFLEASRQRNIRTRVLELDFLKRGVRHTVDQLFEAFSPPFGLLVERPKHVVALMSYLTTHGTFFPRDVFLVCLGHDPFLDFVTPSVAHYRSNWDSVARKLCRLALQLVTEGSLPARTIHWVPDFHDGESLAPVDPRRR